MSAYPPLPAGYEYLRAGCARFMQDHPDYDSNVLVMTRFALDEPLPQLDRELRKTLCRHGLKAHRADDKMYSIDAQLWSNLCIYMLCCKYGVAVLEDRIQNEFNPNVALEYGFMRALSKPTLLLKDVGFRNLRADVLGSLHQEFNMFDIPRTLPPPIAKWIRDIEVGVHAGAAESQRLAYAVYLRFQNIQCSGLVYEDPARMKERNEEFDCLREELAKYRKQVGAHADPQVTQILDVADEVLRSQRLQDLPRVTNSFARLASGAPLARDSEPADVKILFRFDDDANGISDIVVKRTYNNSILAYRAFSFAVLSDTGEPVDPSVWVEVEGQRIPGEIIERFVPDPNRAKAYMCTASFAGLQTDAAHRVVTEYRLRRAGLLSRSSIEAYIRSTQGTVYSNFLYSRLQEHVFFKCPPDQELEYLEIGLILPGRWIPDGDTATVLAYTQENADRDPKEAPLLTRAIFRQDGYFSLTIKKPIPGWRYFLAWTVRDGARA